MVECIIVIGKGIPSHKHAIFLSFITILFALNIHRYQISVSVGVLLHPCLKKALFK